MAAIAVIANKTVSPVNDYQPIMRTYIADEALATGLAVKLDADGRVTKGAATGVTVGIVVGRGATAAGDPVSVLARGCVDGLDVATLDYGALVYAGAAGVVDTAGTVVLGRVAPMSEHGGSKVVEILL